MEESKIKIEELVDLKLLQRLQDTFAQAMGVAAVTVNQDGIPITDASNFCDVCHMIRSTESGLKRCQQCDAEGGYVAHERGQPYAYKCAGGLMDAAAPIIINGHYMGCILCGQVIPEDAYEEYVQDIMSRNIPLGIPPEQFEAAVRKIKPLPRDRFYAAVEMLSLTANNIIQNSAANLAQSQLLQEAQERASLQAALQETELKALKAQINPHFLFNSLTLLGYTALEEDAPRTEEIAYTLSDLLRYSLRNLSSSVELGEEMEMIKQYLAIQKIRFGERLTSQITLDPELKKIEIPCMILQPLVENAVIHGAEPLNRPVMIAVQAYQKNGFLMLDVVDNGVGMPPEIATKLKVGAFDDDGKSIGLQNVYQRLQSEYQNRFSFEVESMPSFGTRLSINIALSSEQSQIVDSKKPDHTQLSNQININHIGTDRISPASIPINTDRTYNRNSTLLTPLQ
ncbi:MAG: PocR ligand-binding domain-containing protein [Anaerolineales bacterium]|nr:PocR ligand-binding domain-containing protein [Anaerolineales bacterium]